MKKIMILSLSVLLVLAIGFLVISHYISEKEKSRIEAILQEGERINEKSKLGLTFLEEKEKISTDSITENSQSDVGMKEPDVTVGEWDVYGYYNQLDNSSSLYLTSIKISKGAEVYHIFGVKTGDDLQNSVDKIINEGYEILEAPESATYVDLEKNGICITLHSSSGPDDEREVSSILIRVKTKDGYKQY